MPGRPQPAAPDDDENTPPLELLEEEVDLEVPLVSPDEDAATMLVAAVELLMGRDPTLEPPELAPPEDADPVEPVWDTPEEPPCEEEPPPHWQGW